MTKEGIQIFFPYPIFFGLPMVQTGGVIEITYVIALLIFIVT